MKGLQGRGVKGKEKATIAEDVNMAESNNMLQKISVFQSEL